jgi:hypothetical protein
MYDQAGSNGETACKTGVRVAIQRDYLQRIIEQFGRALARILTKRAKASYEDLRVHIELACRENTGLDYPLAVDLLMPRLLDMLEAGSSARPHRYLILGDLLQLDGWLLRENDEIGASDERLVRAIWMYLHGTRSPYEVIAGECVENLAALVEELPSRALPHELKRKLVDHFEDIGAFVRAERLLFDLTDTNDPAMIRRGRAFYEHLVKLSRETLEAGGLTREEARRGLARMQ